MKKITLFLLILLTTVAYKVFSQPKKLRSNSTFTQKDHYLNASRSFIIPVHSTFTLDGGLDEPGLIVYNSSIGKLGIYKGSGDWDTLQTANNIVYTIGNQYVSGAKIFLDHLQGSSSEFISLLANGDDGVVGTFQNDSPIYPTVQILNTDPGELIRFKSPNDTTIAYIRNNGMIRTHGTVWSDSLITDDGLFRNSLIINKNQAKIQIQDRSSYATGVGGELVLEAAYRTAHDMTEAVTIKAEKTNSTDGDFGFGTVIKTKKNGVGLLPALSISSLQALRFNQYGAGTAVFDSDGNITSSSDSRLKDSINLFTKGLSEIIQLNPKIFKWKSSSGLNTADLNVGFYAQDVKPILPEAVFYNEQRDSYSLSDRPIIAALVNAIKELTSRIIILEN